MSSVEVMGKYFANPAVVLTTAFVNIVRMVFIESCSVSESQKLAPFDEIVALLGKKRRPLPKKNSEGFISKS